MDIGVIRPDAALEAEHGVVVVIDVFRAANTVLALLEAGASAVLLEADLARARALREAFPARRLLGERGGVAPADFDGGNSPAHAADLVEADAEVVLTTSAGTQAVHRLEHAEAVFFGTFVGASALADAIRSLAPQRVALLPMGLEAREPALEDDLCAEVLAGLLVGRPADFAARLPRLLSSDGAARLRRLGQHDDLAWCCRLDASNLVPQILHGEPPRAVAFARPGG